MEPKITQELLKLPEVQEFRSFLVRKLAELRDIQNILKLDDANELALEVKARLRASEVVAEILGDLLPVEERAIMSDNKEYIIP